MTQMMTHRQRTFIANLFGERVTDGIVVPPLEEMTTRMASQMISQLLKAPRKPREADKPLGSVPDGRYAVDTPTGVKFYIFRTADTGSYHGFQFVSRQSGDNRLRISKDERIFATKAVLEAGTMPAMLRYGRELGVCGHCGRSLTDEDSRARGIGPVCAKMIG